MPAAVPVRRPISVADVFTLGVGPSSSHTVGPMRAASAFARDVVDLPVVRVSGALFGSLALTGRGHHSDAALVWGFAGLTPETIDPAAAARLRGEIARTGCIDLAGRRRLAFSEATDIRLDLRREKLEHPNTMELTAWLADGTCITRCYHSLGGGAVAGPGFDEAGGNRPPFPYPSAASLIEAGDRDNLTIAQMMLRNEAQWREQRETEALLDAIHREMMACIDRGIAAEGVLPGGLGVTRRAAGLSRGLGSGVAGGRRAQDFRRISLWAIAVNEENAAGGRVVTAPTNGAAGVIPAVLRYLAECEGKDRPESWRSFLLTAGAIGALYKRNASISAAEMGCQGEIGVACSMAAGGLAAALGGSNRQIENAAEIGMEHNLGLTCDPVGGLVQVPCIERNAMGAIKAITAAELALSGEGKHVVSLDAVIETMRQTGCDMRHTYKETSLGGLAVNVVEC